MKTKQLSLVVGALGLALGCGGSSDEGGQGTDGPDVAEAVGDWSCLGAVTWRTTRPRSVFLPFQTAPIARYADATLRACAKEDAQCIRPLDRVEIPGAYDGEEQPAGSLEVPTGIQGWQGYAELTSVAHAPILAFELPPVTESRAAVTLPLSPFFLYASAVATAVGITTDPVLGTVGFEATDCAGAPATGALVTIEGAAEDVRPVYFKGDVPLLGEVGTEAESGGIGMLFNVGPGRVTLQITHALTGERIGETQIQVRTGALTTVHLAPTP